MLNALLNWLMRKIAAHLGYCVVLHNADYTDENGNLLIAKQFVCNHDNLINR